MLAGGVKNTAYWGIIRSVRDIEIRDTGIQGIGIREWDLGNFIFQENVQFGKLAFRKLPDKATYPYIIVTNIMMHIQELTSFLLK